MYRLAMCNYAHPAETVALPGSKTTLYIDNHDYDTGSYVDNAIEGFIRTVYQDTERRLVSNQFDAILLGRVSTSYERKHLYFRTHVKYCPRCWKEDPYHRIDWDVTWKAVCEHHNTFLIQKCSQCSRKIYPSNLMGGVCSCGARYDELPVFQACEPVLEAQAIIHGFLVKDMESYAVAGRALSSPEFFLGLDAGGRFLEGTPLSDTIFHGIDTEGWLARYQVRSGGTRDPKMMGTLSAAAYRLMIDQRLPVPVGQTNQ